MRKLPLLVVISALFIASCGTGEAENDGDRTPPLVKAEPATTVRFADRIDAVGTARANEQVTISAPVTERIVRLNFDDGGYVRRGQVIAVLQQAQQSAQLREVQARTREAEQQLERIAELKDRGFATRADYDAQVAAAAAAQAQAQGVRAEIGERVIRAPFSGWVSLRNISVGAIASQGTEIATISDVSTIKLDFTVPETMLSALQPGQPIEARSDAYPGEVFRGQIHTIDPVIDPATRAVMVRARLPNPDRRLRPGMLLTVTIENSPRMALSVPELAVIGEGDQRFVYTVDGEGVARRTLVRTGIRFGGRVEILGGLRPGQRVITEGVVKVTDGVAVRLAGAPDVQRAQAPAAGAATPEGG
ncbi:efflux RND transporter periplasmic adaptor subunit [Sphingosinicella sp. CPCC 101087]|uniref:efflux RND transporter periplasmic adaptor subunit n=1 Tax=Sphingosinicella sp. CPCC 101087 TaxID=2497754 RepID=UPI00101C1A07|nr:efflux RND transporter periplasmic adaptor subunit [Sphingosinicella sp. CPCC 101087]